VKYLGFALTPYWGGLSLHAMSEPKTDEQKKEVREGVGQMLLDMWDRVPKKKKDQLQMAITDALSSAFLGEDKRDDIKVEQVEGKDDA